jgi:hypothetical protein
MLQRHLAAKKVTLVTGVFLRVEIFDKSDSILDRTLATPAHVGWIKSNPTIPTELAEQGQEFTLSTANLDNLLAVQIVAINKMGG